MKLIATSLLLVVLTVAAFSTTATSSLLNLVTNRTEDIRYIIKVDVKSPFEMVRYTSWLEQNNFDVAGYSWRKGEIEVITDQVGVQKLKQNNFSGMAVDSAHFEMGATAIDGRYLDPNKVEQKMRELVTRYPQLARMEQIGTSLQGRAIWALLVSTTPSAGDAEYLKKPSIIFDGMHHAREIMTSEVVMDVAEHSLDLIERNMDAGSLLAQWNIWVVPMLNVDGNNIVWTQKNMWRKNARSEGSNTFGVDINRNYSFNWNRCNGASNAKSNDSYRGTAAGSEPETQALMSLGQKVQPTGYLSYHSYSELVLYPYGCRGVLTGENALVSAVANELAQMLPGDSNRGNYTAGAPWQLLYAVDGDSMSYMFGEFGALSITFEVNQTFQPRYELKEPTVQKHRRAWKYFIYRMQENMLTLNVIDSATGLGLPAQIGISNIQMVQGEKPFRTNASGYYFKVLNAGDYTITVQLADGRSQSVQVKMNGPQSATVRF